MSDLVLACYGDLAKRRRPLAWPLSVAAVYQFVVVPWLCLEVWACANYVTPKSSSRGSGALLPVF